MLNIVKDRWVECEKALKEKFTSMDIGCLSYMLYHDISDDPKGKCPIARNRYEGELGCFIYDTREEAAEAWNRRVGE